ncbi:MAG: von Willebrand factor type A domain-containing protein, partial [Candidatus Zixiibacteriota bacterium]
ELGKIIKVTANKATVDRYCVSSQMTSPMVADATKKGRVCNESMYYPPAHGGTQIVNGEAFDAMFFKNYGVNPFVDTEDDHLSTFAVDVDDASFIMARSYLERGELPPDEAIRTEEFVNHFKYKYTSPESGPFAVHLEGAPSIFGQNCQLLRVGIKGFDIRLENRKPANLVFVVDVSGSMGREDRLGLVRKSLRMLVDNLDSRDQVGIVVYGSCGKVILEPTSINEKEKILTAIEWLVPSGATNAEEGIRLGYQMADKMFEKGKINRIILCSDGVANVGTTGPDEILKQIKSYADKGITLTTVGFGMSNYNDILMEKLGNKGNGFYAYVDDFEEAKKIFLDNLTGTLQVIARDVKIQVDFDPDIVKSYRLLGYENRDVDDDKFRDDKEDGGEIGSGHQVTALYEIKFHKFASKNHVGTIFIRYKDPDNDQVTEINRAITQNDFRNKFENASVDFRLAATAAEFAEILRKSYWAKGSKLSAVFDLAKQVFVENDSEDIVQLMDLISKAEKHQDELAEK